MGSSKKVTVAYKVYLGMHKIYCHGPVDRLMEIKVDGKVAWSGVSTGGPIQISADGLFGGEKREGGVSGRVDFEPGYPDQPQNDYLQSQLGSAIPAFRGVAGLVLRRVYLGLNPYLKRWSVRPKRIHVRQDGLPQWYDGKSEINGDQFSADPANYSNIYGGAELRSIAHNDGVWIAGGQSTNAVRSDGGASWSYSTGGTGNFYREIVHVDAEVWVATTGDFAAVMRSTDNGISWSTRNISSLSPGALSFNCVASNGHTVMVGGSYAGFACVSISLDAGDTWTPYPFSGSAYTLSGANVTSIAHIEGSTWVCAGTTGSTGRAWRSTNNGLSWTMLAPSDVSKVKYIESGIFILRSGDVMRSADGGESFSIWGETPFSARDIEQFGSMVVICGGGGKIAVSYDIGQTWVELPGTFGGGATLNALESHENTLFAVGTGGVLVRINVIPARKGDMNPAHIIRECLTDPEWGMGYAESDIDDDSFRAAADRLFFENMGISILWEKQASIEDFIKEILRHIDGALFVDRRTGKFKLNLIRADYSVPTLPVLGESDIERVENYTRPQQSELFNSITVNYWDTDTGNTATLTVDDPALIQIFGQVKGTTVRYDGFTNADIAGRAGRRDLRAMSTPLLSATLYIKRSAAQNLNPGDAFVFEWPDLHEGGIVMRVTQMNLGDGKRNAVRIVAVEDVFDVPDTSVIADPGEGWVNPVQPPQPATRRAVVELPYYELVQRIGQANADEQLALSPELGFVLASAGRPGNEINAIMSVDAGGGFEDSATIDFCPTAVLSAPVTMLDTEFPFIEGTDMDLLAVGTHAQIGAELVRIDEIHDTHLVVGRGVLDTVPTAHPSGTVIVAWDQFADADQTEYAAGETLEVRLRPVSGGGVLELAAAHTDELQMAGRAIRPYRPGNLQGNGEYTPGITSELVYPVELTWAHRNRLQETSGLFLSYFDGSVMPEPGVTYTVRVVEINSDGSEGDLLNSQVGVDGAEWSLALAVVEDSLAPIIRVGVSAVRDGLESYKEAHLYLPGKLEAPTGLTATAEEY